MSGSATNPWIGKTVGGRFRLDRALGEGGMGAVFEAQDLTNGVRVALKMLRPQLAREEQHLARFRREAEVTGLLAHPHVVRSIATGIDDDGTAWLAMDLVEGQTLSALVRREGVVARVDAVSITRQIVAALAAAHEVGVVHRDLKPANVMVTERAGRRRVTVVDFGIARFVGSAGYEKLTATGLMIGTPSYMAPEQAFGDSIDGRADLYCVGAILHTLLTGQPPFGRGGFEVVLPRVMNNQRERLTVTRRDLGPIVEVVERCLEYEAEDRYQSAFDLDRALAPFDEAQTSVQAWVRPETIHTLVLAPDPVLDAPRPRRRPKTVAQPAQVVPTALERPRLEPTVGAAGVSRAPVGRPATSESPTATRARMPTNRKLIVAVSAIAVAMVAGLVVASLAFFFWRPSASTTAATLPPGSSADAPAAVVPVEVAPEPMRPSTPTATNADANTTPAPAHDTAPAPVEAPAETVTVDPPTREAAHRPPRPPRPRAQEGTRRDPPSTTARGGPGLQVTFIVEPGPIPVETVRQNLRRREGVFRACIEQIGPLGTPPPFTGRMDWARINTHLSQFLEMSANTPPLVRYCIEARLGAGIGLPFRSNGHQYARIQIVAAPRTSIMVR